MRSPILTSTPRSSAGDPALADAGPSGMTDLSYCRISTASVCTPKTPATPRRRSVLFSVLLRFPASADTLVLLADTPIVFSQLAHDDAHHFDGQPEEQRYRAKGILRDVRLLFEITALEGHAFKSTVEGSINHTHAPAHSRTRLPTPSSMRSTTRRLSLTAATCAAISEAVSLPAPAIFVLLWLREFKGWPA